MLPPKALRARSWDLQADAGAHTRRLFDLGQVGGEGRVPSFVKPYDGGGWRAGARVDDAEALTAPTTTVGTASCTCSAPWTRTTCSCAHRVRPPGAARAVRPSAPLHDRYTMDDATSSARRTPHL